MSVFLFTQVTKSNIFSPIIRSQVEETNATVALAVFMFILYSLVCVLERWLDTLPWQQLASAWW